MYGNVTLQDDLTIDEGESLTLDDGASLDANGHNVIVDGGTLDNTLATRLGRQREVCANDYNYFSLIKPVLWVHTTSRHLWLMGLRR